ncbi:MAG TPA: glucoamylase family protein [Acidobacteriaceae bacterium]|nr:glucoamylase family protein [Acidobacteriaceae bacterium]
MTDKVTNIKDGREPTPAAQDAAAVPASVPLETIAQMVPEARGEDTSMMEAELAVVAKVPAPKIERTEEQMRHAALVASQEWHVARAPQGDIFSRRIGAAQSTYRQVFNELDRRPMPTYKPGEALDPLLELRENPRLLQSALDEMHSIRRRLSKLPVVVRPREGDEPRIVTVADTYLKAADSRWDGDWVVWFLEEVQKADPLTLRELWAFPTAVKFLLVEEVLTQAKSQIADPASFDRAAQGLLAARFDGIRNAIYANWAQMIEGLVVFNAVLRQDPVGAYPKMDFDSRERYRERVSEIARHSDQSELEVAQTALRLAQRPAPSNTVPRMAARRAHVGYYLIDKGFPLLAAEIAYQPRWIDRVRIFAKRNADDVYILGILLLTVLLIGAIMVPLVPNYSILGGLTAAFLFLLIPTAQGAVDLMNNTVAALLKATGLAKLDFPKGLPPEFATLVAIPTLLLNEKQVRELVEDLEVRYLANQDPNIHFALLSDLPDSVSRPRPNDTDPLVELAVQLINNLNTRYGSPNDKGKTGGGFYLLHRHRIFNARQGVWMGWERKRGKLLDLNKFILGAFDSFPVKIGNLEVLRTVRYVITLDSDTQLPRGTAHAMVGAMTHPLNRAVIDPESRIVTEGYGILQPRVGVSVHSASRSRLAAIYSGQTGFDIYTRAVSDAYQDLYGEGIFTGKGIYEVQTLHAVLDRRFPRNSLLSHDLIEGAYARAGLATDIEVIDDYPSHYSAYRRRQHRWVRGDWQIAQWLFSKVPDESGHMVKNPISNISRWKIFDNLRRSLVETMTLILLVAGWLGLPGGPLYWTLVTVILLFAPSLVSLVFSVGRAWASPQKGEVQEAFVGFGQNLTITLINLAFLPHQMLMALDAIIRSLVRRFITGQRLLEWETAAQAESTGGTTTPVDRYLQATPIVTIGIALVVAIVHRQSLVVAAPLLLLWLFESTITAWLNHPPRDERQHINGKQKEFLREMALRTWRFFYEYGGAKHNYLVPDNVEEDELFEAARVSPTNFGLLLNARQAAHTFGYLTVTEFVELSHRSLDTFDRMEKRNGHIYNWYDTRTLKPIVPRVVSSVDSGNLAASFYTLRSGAEAMLLEPLVDARLWAGLRDQTALLDTLDALPPELAPIPEGDGLRPWLDWCCAAQLSPAFDHVRDPDGQPFDLTDKAHTEGEWWLAELLRRVNAVCSLMRDYAPWLDREYQPLEPVLKEAGLVPIGRGVAYIDDLDARLQRAWSGNAVDQAEIYLLEKLRALLAMARERQSTLVTRLHALALHAESCVAAMDFAFLIEPSRGILSIGYMVEQEELHKACYDLLCSEARIGAFVAVARGDASQQSWFKLGRIHTVAYGRPALISWTGTMFEYLMPALWMRSYPDTLVTRTLDNVVAIQRAYAKEHGNIPWGISECGYAEKDDQGHYHYLAFGMPSIALKWDAIAGPVISPYSSFLALMIDEMEALKNLKRMASMGWVGAYGFYEAGDYQKSLKKPALVKEWMAHHQGMSLLAVLNLLHNNMAQEWFHANANLKATELLLHEKPIRESLLLAEYKESGKKRSAA